MTPDENKEKTEEESMEEMSEGSENTEVVIIEDNNDSSFSGMSNEQVDKALGEFPKEALSSYGGVKGLTSIKAQYIVERLNDVFGYGNWNAEYEIITEGTVPFPIKDSENTKDKYVVIMRCMLSAEGTNGVEHFGGATLKVGQDLNDVFKSAATDGLTKCASQLGIGNDVFKGLVSVTDGYKKGAVPSSRSFSQPVKQASNGGDDLAALLN